MLVTVEHSHVRNYGNAMSAWAEGSGSLIRICARELENFDGIHSGIKLVNM